MVPRPDLIRAPSFPLVVMVSTKHLTNFDEFSFDLEKLVLYFQTNRIKSVDKKLLEVLAALVRRPNELVLYDEIIAEVWADNLHGATPARVNQSIYKLQKVMGEYSPSANYFENVRGRGYIFTGEVRRDIVDEDPATAPEPSRDADVPTKTHGGRRFLPFYIAGAVLMVTALAAWMWYPRGDEDAVKRVVTESQMYETLVLYKNPTAFKEADLDKFWTPELQSNANYDRSRIRDAVKKMVDEGRKYGDESKCEQFEFQSVEIDKAKKTAVVKTLEKWFVAVYQTDGTLLRNRTVGPYFVSYVLRKIDGRWLIEKSTTGRVNRPIPRVSEIETVSEVRAGQQFLATITGKDFEIETIYMEVVGPGCPELKPCKIPNSILREQSKMSDTSVANIPLTLASGNFKIVARNGDSQPSEPFHISVP